MLPENCLSRVNGCVVRSHSGDLVTSLKLQSDSKAYVHGSQARPVISAAIEDSSRLWRKINLPVVSPFPVNDISLDVSGLCDRA